MGCRTFLCLAAACCLFCIALLPPPAQGRRPGLQAVAGGGYGARRLLRLLPAPEPHIVPTLQAQATAAEAQRGGVPMAMKARPRPAARWSVRPELRAVPGGPDPLHHHGGGPSRRPEPEQGRTPSP